MVLKNAVKISLYQKIARCLRVKNSENIYDSSHSPGSWKAEQRYHLANLSSIRSLETKLVQRLLGELEFLQKKKKNKSEHFPSLIMLKGENSLLYLYNHCNICSKCQMLQLLLFIVLIFSTVFQIARTRHRKLSYLIYFKLSRIK